MHKAFLKGFNAKYLFERNGHLTYRRGIPTHLQKLAGRYEFKESLHTEDLTIARIRYAEIHAKYERVLAQLRQGIPYDPKKPPRLEELVRTSESYGHIYLPAQEMIRRNDLGELLRRFEVWERAGSPQGSGFDALFGSQPDPIKLSDALTFYETHIRDELIGLDNREQDKKLNPKRGAIQQLINFVGEDLDILAIKRSDALDFRSHLLDRIVAGQIIDGTANKILGHIRSILNVNIKQRGLEITNPFSELRVKEEKRARSPFSIKFIQDKWLVPGVFDELNEECRNLLFAMLDTGCGQKELCGLDPESDIKLDHEIPHIIVRPNRFRKLKTAHRDREIPLIGYALRAFNAAPNGFPRYRRENGSEAASALLMKFLRNHGLLESPDHSVYSLRHTFKDRMRVHGLPIDLQNDLMGHKDPSMGAHYGAGYSIKDKMEQLRKLEADWQVESTDF